MTQMDLLSYRDGGPGWKAEGPSKEAAVKVASKSELTRGKIHWLLMESSAMTADEIASRLDLSILYIRPRVSELVKLGRVVDSGERGRNTSGMSATKWAAA